MKHTGVKKPALLAALLVTLLGAQSAHAQTELISREIRSKYFTVEKLLLGTGEVVEKNIISGPPKPPAGYELERAAVALPEPGTAMAAKTLPVPAYDWVFGCSAVSGAMIAAYYDRNGFPNMYTGPTSGGMMPLDSSIWGTWDDGDPTMDPYPLNPLIASRNGLDGRATKGSIDDYWVQYDSTTSDPYITGAWTQHAWGGDAIGDYMKTSQSAFGNRDGSTMFYTWQVDPSPLTCSEMEILQDTGAYINTLDGTYGRKLFYEARGYTVGSCYNQKTDNQAVGGFSFVQFKAEIDASRPVMLNLDGHTIVGVGYNDATTPKTVYIHDTWDYLTHEMPWGGVYSGMTLLSVSIVTVQMAGPVTTTIPASTTIPTTSIPTTTTSITTTTTSRPTTSTTTSSIPTTTSTLLITTTTALPGTPVTADLTGCVEVDGAPADVQLVNASTGDIKSWLWSFGDDGSSYAQNPVHRYKSQGNFTVKLTVTGSDGKSATKISEDCVKVGACALSAGFSGAPASGTAPLEVSFTDMSEGDVSTYAWSFGDGGTSSEKSPTHTYNAGGDYIVMLKVSGGGCSDAAIKINYIHVEDDLLKKLCGIQAAVEGRPDAENHAAVLRNFRNNRLAMSFTGSFLIALYYINSPELVRIFEANPELKQEFGDIVEAYAPRIGQGLAWGPAAFNALEIARIENMLQAIEEQGSWLLMVSIRYAVQQIRQEALLQQYGIVVLP